MTPFIHTDWMGAGPLGHMSLPSGLYPSTTTTLRLRARRRSAAAGIPRPCGGDSVQQRQMVYLTHGHLFCWKRIFEWLVIPRRSSLQFGLLLNYGEIYSQLQRKERYGIAKFQCSAPNTNWTRFRFSDIMRSHFSSALRCSTSATCILSQSSWPRTRG